MTKQDLIKMVEKEMIDQVGKKETSEKIQKLSNILSDLINEEDEYYLQQSDLAIIIGYLL